MIVVKALDDDDTKIFRFDGLDQPQKAFPLIAARDFFGYTDGRGKRDQHQVAPGDG